MKICHVVPFFSIKYNGGTSSFVSKLCKAQIESGLAPTVMTSSHEFDSELAQSLDGVKFEVFKSFFSKLGVSLMPGLVFQAKKEVSRFDVVHFHAFRTVQNLVLYKACKAAGVPFVMDVHGSAVYMGRKIFLKRLYDRLWGRKMLSDAGFLVGETEVGRGEYYAVNNRLEDKKIKTISLPIDPMDFSLLPEKGQFRERFKITKKQGLIIFLGRIDAIKGIDFLIRGFHEHHKSNPNDLLYIIGPDSGYLSKCKLLAQELDIQTHVFFPGYLDDHWKKRALVDADILAQVSRKEQGGRVPYEAILCETPVIVTRATGSGEDVRKIDGGFFIDIDDVVGLGSQMSSILKNMGAAKAKTLNAKNSLVEAIDFQKNTEEYLILYQALSKNGPGENKGGI